MGLPAERFGQRVALYFCFTRFPKLRAEKDIDSIRQKLAGFQRSRLVKEFVERYRARNVGKHD